MVNNNPEGDIKGLKENIEPPVEVSLPEVPDLHENHLASMRWRHGHHESVNRQNQTKPGT